MIIGSDPNEYDPHGTCDGSGPGRAEEGLSFLSRASAILGSSLDYEVTLRSVAQLVVPRLGDWCLMHLTDVETASCVAFAHVDPEKHERLRELVAQRTFDGALLGAESVLASGATEYHDQWPLVLDAVASSDLRAQLEVLGAASAMHVPLNVTGRTLGVLTIVSSFADRAYDDEHLLVAEELARRAAVAVDHARVHREAKVAATYFHTILSTVSDGITTQDRDGKLLFANDAAAHLCGLPNAETMLETGSRNAILSPFEMYDEDGHPLSAGDLPGRRVFVTGTSAESVVGSRHRLTGRERWAVVRATPLLDESGRPCMVVNVMHDYTAQKKAVFTQKILAEASAALGESLDGETIEKRLLDLLVPRFASVAVLYYTDAQKPPRAVGVAPSPSSTPSASSALAAARQSCGVKDALAGRAARFSNAPEDGAFRDLGIVAHGILPLTSRAGVEAALVMGWSDEHRHYEPETISLVEELVRRAALAIENARLYRESRDAVKAREVFLSVASHELRTPLTSLRLQSQSIGRDLRKAGPSPLATTIAPKVAALETQLRRLTELVNGLLDVSRITGQKLQLFPERTDLTALTEEVAHRFKPLVARSGCAMRLDLAGQVCGTWDRLRIDQVITNLLSNALKYGASRPIEVVLREEHRRARLTVRDEGIGIAREDHRRIFERFERAVGETSVPGFGMGLWIAREIVEAHAGHIVVESAPGMGSRFTVELPTDPADVARGRSPTASASGPKP